MNKETHKQGRGSIWPDNPSTSGPKCSGRVQYLAESPTDEDHPFGKSDRPLCYVASCRAEDQFNKN